MAGHNKWSQIKHKKAKEDSKRGKAFTKLIKELTVAAREGGGDPAGNARLRNLMDKARFINMPAENVTRAVKRGTGELPGVNYEPFTYEGYAPHGVAVLVETLSDNKNRTIADMRHMFSKGHGNLGEAGSVEWMFDHLGVLHVTGPQDDDEIVEALLDYDIKDVKKGDNFYTIFCDSHSLHAVKEAAQKASMKVESAELEWVAKNPITLDESEAEKVVEFLSTIHDHDDVQNVYSTLG